jgi:hypothetical protein
VPSNSWLPIRDQTAEHTGRAQRAALVGDNQRTPRETNSARIARPVLPPRHGATRMTHVLKIGHSSQTTSLHRHVIGGSTYPSMKLWREEGIACFAY